jgi:signal transduction histidine kinase/DNA-binding NarL/FixJ family response regulator
MSQEHQRERDLLRKIAQLERDNAALQSEASDASQSRLIAEEALGLSEDRLQLALDAAGLASWEWDIPAELVTTSARFAHMLDSSEEIPQQDELHWLPRDLLGRILPDDVASLRAAITRLLKNEDVLIEQEFRLTTPQGTRWIECTGKVVSRDMLGRAERVIGISRNVTRRKIAEQEMQDARSEAEAANQAKDKFLAHISHEIRTPLNGVIGMNNLLAQTELSKEQRQYVDLVGSSGRALLALVNDVLDYSRFSAQGMVLEQVRFPLRKWLWEAVMPLQISAQSKGLELKLAAAEALPKEMVGDPGRMRQIVSNLVSNAIKFTERGSVQVEMRCDAAAASLQISVKDTGIGIAHDKQQAIFDAFVQADSSTSRRYGGTGLGLAISMQLAQAMGGRIELKSQLGAGSQFIVTIPLQALDASASQQDFASTQLGSETVPAGLFNPNASLPRAANASYLGKLALVADDHEVNRLLASKLLERLGFEVTLAHDGEQAIEAVLQRKFDVILMDIQMPRMNGWQAASELRKWEQQTQCIRVPIIALSAHASAADREQALSVGMDGYLSKPLTPEALASALRATGLGRGVAAASNPTAAFVKAITNTELSRDLLLKRLGGDEQALREMIRAMRRDLRERMGLAYEAMQRQDWPAMHAQAHALKGALASVTAGQAAAHAAALEQVKDSEHAQTAFQALSVEAKKVFDTLKTW